MFKKIWEVYKTQFLVSLTLAIVLIATSVIRTPLNIFLTAAGVLLGTFILDLDYFIYAYFLEPEKGFSKSLRGFIEHKDYSGALNHIYFNRSEVKDKALNSAMFQIFLAGATLLAVASNTGLIIKALIISVLANSIYKISDYYFEGRSTEWFWVLKKTPDKKGVLIYVIALVLVLVYSITLFKY